MMKTKTIKQTVTLNAKPAEAYRLLMDPKIHAAITDSPVTMSTKVKGKFSVLNGYCHGYNIELKEGKKIVQAWHFADDGWPADHYSICTFIFKKEGDKTKISFEQADVPERSVETLKGAWKYYYWDAMKEYLKHNKE